MRRNLFLVEGRAVDAEFCLPPDVRGVERADDRRVISGIVYPEEAVVRMHYACDRLSGNTAEGPHES